MWGSYSCEGTNGEGIIAVMTVKMGEFNSEGC